jgi:signal transduction histidine kinase
MATQSYQGSVDTNSAKVQENPSPSLALESLASILHSIGNKLLPILVFSELALRQCEDEKVRRQLEKINHSAEEVRDLVLQLQEMSQVSGDHPVIPTSSDCRSM